MTGLLDGAVSLLDRRQLASVWLPVIAFLASLATVAAAGAGWHTSIVWWNHLDGDTKILIVLATLILTVLASQMLGAARPALIRCYEGYWPERWPVGHLRRRLTATHLHAQQRRSPNNPELFLAYPRSPENTLPTSLGNILRAAEEHGDRYGLDPVTTWPRLYLVLPEAFRTSFAHAAAPVETAVVVSFLGGLFALIGGVVGVLFLSAPGATACVWSGTFVAILAYRTAVRAAKPYAQLVRAAFDVHRFLLLEAMRLRLPSSPAEEHAQWRQLTKLWYQGAADFDRIDDLRYPHDAASSASASPQPLEAAVQIPVPQRQAIDVLPRISRIRPLVLTAALMLGLLAGVLAATLP